ncbi:hypothetical protein HWB81_gp16 [Bacillus phage Wes44]|uniref:Uncharacterized protein n=1 Tax=Bacillus phage Wes44 TaxID=2283012 RepID=A0A346FK20_9CAUD|nr:hypothetical protein HWB81_gp16 [Bacillus phage Wes44]AXN58325.1 hypothetical protein Wes44_16 [Bacillus phage Wes44]
MLTHGFSRVAILNALLSYGYNSMVAKLYVERFEAKNKIKIS